MNRQEILDQISQTLGSVPGWLASFPDPQLEHMWGIVSWVLSDSRLTAQQKALVAFGAAAAVHCPYCTPFHTEQLRLGGMDDAHIQEASATSDMVAGFSAYLHGIGYSREKFLQELNSASKHMRSKEKAKAGVR